MVMIILSLEKETKKLESSFQLSLGKNVEEIKIEFSLPPSNHFTPNGW